MFFWCRPQVQPSTISLPYKLSDTRHHHSQEGIGVEPEVITHMQETYKSRPAWAWMATSWILKLLKNQFRPARFCFYRYSGGRRNCSTDSWRRGQGIVDWCRKNRHCFAEFYGKSKCCDALAGPKPASWIAPLIYIAMATETLYLRIWVWSHEFTHRKVTGIGSSRLIFVPGRSLHLCSSRTRWLVPAGKVMTHC